MQVQIKDVQVEWAGEGRKKYGKAVVNYSYNGEARRQQIMSFANPDVFKKVQELTGQTVEVEVGKNDKGYSEWRSIAIASAAAHAGSGTSSASTTRVSGSNYETKEERAHRQVLIAKQSSLKAAVDILTPGAKSALDANAVIELAEKLTDWVLAQPAKDLSIEGMSDDLPF